MPKPPSSELTPEPIYRMRRQLLKGLGAAALSTFLPGGCAAEGEGGALDEGAAVRGMRIPKAASLQAPTRAVDRAGGEAPTDYEAITSYNNFYEFSTDKKKVAVRAKDFVMKPWAIEVGGLVRRPATFDVDSLLRRFPPEDRIYRLRCVEAWSMVVPWRGFPLAGLLRAVEPTSDARFVKFTTLYDPERMPGQKARSYPWPYTEGLRLDEAMHELTLLATGIYGKDLLPQNGGPIRLVVPWKYGFKSIKSIVKIELVAEQPTSLWMASAPSEYGFYANVNPLVSHPRWSQASERRIGELRRRRTLMFNGYAEEVAHLYDGMDLKTHY
jgi:sulfoxide reductase catalytic subunit YedY